MMHELITICFSWLKQEGFTMIMNIKRALHGKTTYYGSATPIVIARSPEGALPMSLRGGRRPTKQSQRLLRSFQSLAMTILMLMLVLPCASAKEFGVVEGLYVGRNTTTPYGGIGRYENRFLYSEAVVKRYV